MISISINGLERLQFQFILPVQGSLEALELVDKIFKRVKIVEAKESDTEESFNFEDEEICFITEMINILDTQKKLNFSSLSLVRKILNYKEGDCS